MATTSIILTDLYYSVHGEANPLFMLASLEPFFVSIAQPIKVSVIAKRRARDLGSTLQNAGSSQRARYYIRIPAGLRA